MEDVLQCVFSGLSWLVFCGDVILQELEELDQVFYANVLFMDSLVLGMVAWREFQLVVFLFFDDV